MADYHASVKAMTAALRRTAANAVARGDHKSAETYTEWARATEELLDEYEKLRLASMPVPADYGDLADLPKELLAELTGLKSDPLEQQLLALIKGAGREIDLDIILIEMFRRHKVIQTRRFLQNKLWRMVQKGMIFIVSGRKGVYTIEPQQGPQEAEPEDATPPPSRFTEFAPSQAMSRKPSFDDDLDDDVPF